MENESILNKVLKKNNNLPNSNDGVLKELNPKQKLALEYYARGMSQIESARQAGYTVEPNARCCPFMSRLIRTPEGKLYLEEIRRIKRDEAKDISDLIVQRWVDQAQFCISDIVESKTYNVTIDEEKGTTVKKTNLFLKEELSKLPKNVLMCLTEISSKGGELSIKWDSSKALDNLAKLVNLFDSATQEDLKKAFANAGLAQRPDDISDTDDTTEDDE